MIRAGILGKLFSWDVPVIIELDGGDHNVGWVNANGCGCAVRFVSLYTLDVHYPLLPVHLGNLSFSTLVFSPYNPNLIVLAYGKRASLCKRIINVYITTPSESIGLTLYLPLRSFERGDDIIFRLIEEGAAKCALRDFRREEEVSAAKIHISTSSSTTCPSDPPNALSKRHNHSPKLDRQQFRHPNSNTHQG